MEVKYLSEDDLLVELEVRSMVTKGCKNITDELVEALAVKLEGEKENQKHIPLRAHYNAKKNPKRELRVCGLKMTMVKQQLLAQDTSKEIEIEMVDHLMTQVLHTHGRLVRISSSPVVQKDIGSLVKASLGLCNILNKIREKKAALNDSVNTITEIAIPHIILAEEDELRRETKQAKAFAIHIPGATTSTARVSLEDEEDTERSGAVGENEDPGEAEESLVESLIQLKGRVDDQLSRVTEEAGRRRRSPTIQRNRRESVVSDDMSEFDEIVGAAGPLDPKICKDPSSWGLKFEGTRSEMPIERFFFRVERMASKSKIDLGSLVDYMVLLLKDEALEWYWTLIESTNKVTWGLLKKEMIQRFQASRSEDDIRRSLNQRKQRYPAESFLVFYDAILKLALQLRRQLSDQEMYRLLRRNMRPGLQLKLYNTKSFPSVSHFVRKCVELEDRWERFGVNPEGKLAVPTPRYNTGNNNFRSQNYTGNYPGNSRFQPKPQLRVHEVVVGEDEDYYEEEDLVYPENEYEDYSDEVCALNGNPRVNFQLNQRPQQQSSSLRPQTNYGKPPGDSRDIKHPHQ